MEHLTISAWNGAFLKSDNSTAANVGRDFEGYGRVVTFTANRSNSIYGASNIYGQFNDAHAGTCGTASGVLGWQQTGERGIPGITEIKWQYGNLILDVGFANSLFGSSTTVQPSALQGILIIKS